jgi:hypothetical protein
MENVAYKGRGRHPARRARRPGPRDQKKFGELGFFATGSTSEAYLDKLKFETERWTKVVKDNNIKVEG